MPEEATTPNQESAASAATTPPPVTTSDKAGNGEAEPNEEPKWLAGRLERERKAASEKALEEMVKKLGLSKPDEVEAIIKAHREAEEAKKTDAEKAAKAIKDAQDAAAKVAAERDALLAEKRDRLRAEAIVEEVGTTVKRAADVVMWIRNERGSEFATILGEDGKLAKPVVKSLIAACKEARPEWFKEEAKSPGSPSNAGKGRTDAPPDGDKPKPKTRAELLKEARKQYGV